MSILSALDELYPCPEPGCHKSYLSPADILQHRMARHPRNHICPKYLCQALCTQTHLEFHAHDDKVKSNASKHMTQPYQSVQKAAPKWRSGEDQRVQSQEYKGGNMSGIYMNYQLEKPPKVPKLDKAPRRIEHKKHVARGCSGEEYELVRTLDSDYAFGPSPRPSHSHPRPQSSRSVVRSQRRDASVSNSMDALDRDFFSHALGASPRPSHNHSRPTQTTRDGAPSQRKDSCVGDSMNALDRAFFAHVLADPPTYAPPMSYTTTPSSSYASQPQGSGYAHTPSYQGALQPTYTTTYGRNRTLILNGSPPGHLISILASTTGLDA